MDTKDKHTTDKRVIQLAKEQLVVSKETVETGKVTIDLKVDTVPVEQSIDLTSDQYSVRRIPKDEFVTAPIPVQQTDDTIIISVVEEVLVVEKKIRLIEEIHVQKSTTVTPETVTANLRKQFVDIDKSA